MKRNRIIQLPRRVYEKIAAGEVVTGPLSAVKELTENAIDAEARSIVVEIKEGGKSYIRVTDDGEGIPREDVESAFLPHATSKIAAEGDLDSIDTLGFRGEALSSIAAVSRMEISTKTADSKVGVSLSSEGGVIGDIKDVGAADGTTVVVRDLYFNTPARFKFMKSDRAESSAIIDFVSKIAVAYPHIRVKMINNGDILFSTNGKGDVLQAVLTVYGANDGEGLISAEGHTERMSLKALISGPNKSKKSRRSQILFVNGRYVADDTVAQAIADAYKEYVFEGRFPIVYLFLRIDPTLVDVNVHPAKNEIRFSDGRDVANFVRDTLRATLASKAGIPVISSARGRTREEMWEQRKKETEFYALRDDRTGGGKTSGSRGDLDRDEKKGSAREDEGFVHSVNINKLWSTSVSDSVSDDSYESAGDASARGWREDAAPDTDLDAKNGSADECANAGAKTSGVQSEMNIASLHVLGSVFATYLLAADNDSFYIIDQHAAHERVNYERFLSQRRSENKQSQQLLTPMVLQLPAAAKSAGDDWAGRLSVLGFEAELFGKNALIVKAFPAFLPYAEAELFLRDVIDNASDAPPDNDRALERLISRACKQSVKGNDMLSSSEIASLLDDLSHCENPYTCPHGRPVFVRMSKRDLERMFKRA
ncbi:MAG: DNA mismatch repair endonuclease MutL [Clostridiales Family XIII bacterium]|jgi:DNA mismatch repair protein MutL|nr:DNA mismatch repair endonuclease MutL [Clostridiales Family XIII bacterium]